MALETSGTPVGAEEGKRYIKYGGMRFSYIASPEEIDAFVRDLPASERESLFEVVKTLEREGFIRLHDGDLTTIDDEMEPYLETGPRARAGRGGPDNPYPLDIDHGGPHVTDDRSP